MITMMMVVLVKKSILISHFHADKWSILFFILETWLQMLRSDMGAAPFEM